MAPSSARVPLLLATVLAFALLATRHGDAAGAAPAPAPAASGFGCNPLRDRTCKPGDAKAPEEAGIGPARFPGLLPTLPIPGFGKVDRDGDGDIDEDDELPAFNTHMTILGH